METGHSKYKKEQNSSRNTERYSLRMKETQNEQKRDIDT